MRFEAYDFGVWALCVQCLLVGPGPTVYGSDLRVWAGFGVQFGDAVFAEPSGCLWEETLWAVGLELALGAVLQTVV